MRRFRNYAMTLFVVAASAIFSCCSPKYKYETVANDPLNAKIYTLPNGLKVYMTVNKEQPRIQTFIAVRTGGKNDPHETTGLAHYLEHLMFKGTENFGTQDYAAEKVLLDQITELYEVYRTKTDEAERKAIYHQIDSISFEASKLAIPNEYDKMMAVIGASGTNAYTSEDVTCYTEDIPSNQIENWAKIQSDRFMNPVFRLFHTELETVYEEKNMSLVQDRRKVFESLYSLLFKNHPYGTQTVIGTQDHLKNPSIVNIRNYFNTYYVPNNVAICLSGDFEPDYMMDMIVKYFGDWKKNETLELPIFPAEDPITEPAMCEVLGQEAENVMMGWRFPKAASREAEILEVIGSVLNNGKAGLIDLNLNQAQKVLGVYAGNDNMADYSLFIIGGHPLPGQTLDEVRELALGEVAKLRAGEFDDELLESVKTEMKLQQQRSLERNRSRADMFVQSFINGIDWKDAVTSLDRKCALTKEDIVKFANEYLRDDNYVYVNKRQGVDPNIKKIDKPAITPIESNRDAVSQFVLDVKAAEPAPIEPVFVDFEKDIQKETANHDIPVLYVKNITNQLFNLSYIYEYGKTANRLLPYAVDYLDYLGTSEISADDIQKRFYALGCNFYIRCGDERLTVNISGLNENLPKAVALVDQILNDVQPNEELLPTLKDAIMKSRNDAKKSQSSNYNALMKYAYYGAQYIKEMVMTDAEIAAIKGSDLTDLIHAINGYKHRVTYYGPSDVDELLAVINEYHANCDLAEVPANKKYKMQSTPENVTYLAPYTANNIYLAQFSNYETLYSPEIEVGRSVYNEYFGGSMNGVVFQEMRETRGLAYSARANFVSQSDKTKPYYYTTMIATQNDKLNDALTHFNEIIENLPESEPAFDNAMTALVSRLRTERTFGNAVISAYLSAERCGITEDPCRNIYENVQGWTLANLVAYQQKMVKGRKYTICVLGDKSQLDLSLLKSMGQIKEISTEEIFGY